jgi:hypothetical protein
VSIVYRVWAWLTCVSSAAVAVGSHVGAADVCTLCRMVGTWGMACHKMAGSVHAFGS